MQEQEYDILEQEEPKPKPKLPGMGKVKPTLPGLSGEKKNLGVNVGQVGGTVGNSKAQSSAPAYTPNTDQSNPFSIGGQYNQPKKLDAEGLDLINTKHDAAIAEQIKKYPLRKIPLTPILDNTALPKPISEIDANEAIARGKQHKIDMETAIDNTTLKVLKQKGIVAGKGSPYYEAERKKIEEKTKPTMIGGIVINGAEATYHKDKDGNIGLDRNLGFLEGIRKGFNAAVDGEDEANAFAEMNTQQKVEYANKQMEGKPTEYMEERGGVGELLGGATPYLVKAAAAGTLATAAAIAAPETGGASLVGLAPTLTVLLTAPDMIKQGAKDEIMTRYQQLKQERPNIPDEELMKIAEQGGISGGIVGAAEALAFTTTLKLPILNDSKSVLKTYLKGVASSAVHLGGIMAGTKAAQLAERKLEGYNVDTDKAVDEIATTFTENATAGAILNGLISGAHTLPKVIKSAFKYSLKDTPTSEIKTALDANVQAGRIPPEVADQTIADIEGYKTALAKTSDGLTPETQASVAGLIQARDNVAAEMATKDPTQRAVYEQKIEAYNKQIEKITKTNDPLKYEIDEVTGNPIDKVAPKGEPENISQPIELSTETKPSTPTVQEGKTATKSVEATPKGNTSNVEEGSGGVGGDAETKQQIENFGVNKADVEPVHSVISQVFNGLKKAGLTAAKTVGDWVGIGKGEEKTYSLKINGKDTEVRSVSPEVVNGFYSPLEKTINETKLDKLPAKQWIDKFGKSEEAKWTGLTDWLQKQEGSVSKADIQNYLKDNRIQVVEVVNSGKSEKYNQLVEEQKNASRELDILESDSDNWSDENYKESRDKKYELNDKIKELSNKIKEEESKTKDTKFENYQLEGEKENYREVLVTMPVAKSKQEYVVEQDYRTPDTFYAVNQKTGVKLKFGSYELAKSQAERLSKEAQPDFGKQFKSSHFEEPNIVVHLRMNTRTDAEGNKVLFLEEVQSDWGQKGKKEGFDNKLEQRKELEKRGVTFNNNGTVSLKSQDEFYEQGETWELIKKYNDTYTNKAITPTAPFVTDTNAWTKLGLKVALKEAVKQGATKIAWTTGEQQNDRYDLSKSVDGLEYQPQRDGKYDVFAHKDDNNIFYEKGIDLKRIEDVFGKDIADKISKNEGTKATYDPNKFHKRLEGDGLKVGGKGMKGFYGSPTEGNLGIVGNVAKSLFKQEPKTVEIETAKNNEYTLGEANYVDGIGVYDGKGDMVAEFDTKAEANKFIASKSNQTQHSIDITPELKASVEGGQPLFKDAEAQYRIENGKNIVEAIKDFDGSPRATVALTHEVMHPTVVAIIDGAKEGNEVGKKHTKTIVDEFNKANPNNKVTAEDLIKGNDAFKEGTTTKQYRQVQEFIAKSWEKYHREGGKGFSEQFQKVLDQITKAFKAVYKSLKGEQLTPELRKMFDEILGKEAAEQSLKETTKAETPTPKGNTSNVGGEPKTEPKVNEKTEVTQDTKQTEGVIPTESKVDEVVSDTGTGKEGGKKEPPIEPAEPVGEGKGKDRLNDKGVLNHLVEAENVPEVAKAGFKEKGLKYTTASQKEAEMVAKSVIDKYGVEDAVLLAEAQKFDGDVNSLIYAESLNRLAKSEDAAKTPEEKIEAAKKFAEVGLKYDEAARKGGRFSSAINYFYKKSPLGVQMIENAKRKEDFEGWAKPKDQSWKEFFDEMVKEPEFDAIVKEQVKEGMKQERAEARAARIKKVDEFFDKAKDQFKGGATYSTIIPPRVITTALEGMKKAYHAGEKVAKIIEDAVDYISDQLGNASWDKDKFRKEWEEKLQDKPEKKKLTDEEAKAKILDRFRNKLKGLTDKQKEEVVRKSFKKIVESGGLDYADFRKIIADVTGRGEMTDAEAVKLKELIQKTNAVDEAAQRARTERTQESRKVFYETEKSAGKASRELNELLYNKPNITKRLTSLMQLNTLGIPALVNNPVYNVINQLGIRTPVGLVKTGVDRLIQLGGKMVGKDIQPETDILSVKVQREFFKKLGLGTRESVGQFLTGLNRMDYINKEIQGQQIRPATAMRDLWAYSKGEKNLTKAQLIDKIIQASPPGITAEIIARTLNLGDKPQRFAAEGAQAAAFAKSLGLKDIDYDLFIDFPREEAYRVYKNKGLSDAEAAQKADYVKDTIIKEGERSTFQQDNMLNDALNKIFGGKDSGIGGLAKATVISPYIKIPSNAYWSYYNIVNPEVAMLQSMIYAGKAYAKTKGAKFSFDKHNSTASKDLNEAKYWFAHAAVGMATRAVIISLVNAGVYRPANTEDDTKKEREGEQFYENQGTVNLSKLSAIMRGEDPNKVENGLIVQNRWFGHWGTVGNTIAKKNEEMTAEQKQNNNDFWDAAIGGLELDALKDLNQGVFGNTSSLLQAVNNNGVGFQSWGVNTLNMFTNIVHPAASAQIERANLPYYNKNKSDNFIDELKNSMLARSAVLRKLTGEYPPSKIGIWGDRMDKKDNVPMRLFGISRANPDNFAQPIYEDYKRTNNTKFFPPAVLPTITDNGERVKLPTADAARFEELVGQQRKRLIAPYVNDMARFEGSSKTYSKLTDEEKIDKLNIIYEEGYNNAKAIFLKEKPQYKVPAKTSQQKNSDKDDRDDNRTFRKAIKNKKP